MGRSEIGAGNGADEEWPFGPFTRAVLKALDAAQFTALARATTWGEEERKVIGQLGLPTTLDPKHVRTFGKNVIDALGRLTPLQAIILATALSRPLYEVRGGYGLGETDRVTLEVLRAAVPRMLADFGSAATRLMLAVVADVPPSAASASGQPLGLGSEDEAYHERVSLRCAIVLRDEPLDLPEFAGIPVPVVSREDEERDAPSAPEAADPPPAVTIPETPPAAPDAADEDEMNAHDGSDGVRVSAAELEQLRHRLEGDLKEAADLVAEGGMPPPGLPRAITDFEAHVSALGDQVAFALREADVEHAVDRTPAGIVEALTVLDEAVESRRRSAEATEEDARRAQVEGRIQRLVDRLPPASALPDQVGKLLEGQFDRLRDTDDWSDAEESVATALAVLGDVHQAAEKGDRPGFLEILMSRGALIPDELKPILVAIEGLGSSRAERPDPGGGATAPPRVESESVPSSEGADRQSGGSDADAGSEEVGSSDVGASSPSDRPSPVGAGTGVEGAVARCLREGALGLAHQIARAAEWSDPETQVLAAAAYAENIRSNIGASAAAYDRETQEFTLSGLEARRGLQLLALASAVRASLVAPVGGATAVLEQLDNVIDDQATKEFLLEVRRNQGLLLAAGESDVDAVDIEARIVETVAAAERLLVEARRRRGPFHRATAVWWDWIHENGWLGSGLGIVASDARDRVDRVRALIRELSDPRDVIRMIQETDEGNGKGPIEAKARDWLLRSADEVAEVLRAWTAPVLELATIERSGAQQDGSTSSFRAKVRSLRASVFEWLDREEKQAGGARPDVLRLGCIAAVRASLDRSFRLVVEREALTGSEMSAEDVLNVDVARALEVPFSAFVTDDLDQDAREAVSGDLAAALDVAPLEAFEHRLAAHELRAARLILERLRQGAHHLAEIDALEVRLQRQMLHATEAKGARLRDCEAAIARARHQQHFFREQKADSAIQKLIEDLEVLAATISVEDFPVARQRLDGFLDRMRGILADGQERARRTLSDIAERYEPHADDVLRVERAIDSGELETADGLMVLLAEGMALPAPRDYTAALEAFWPSVPRAFKTGPVTPEHVLKAIRAGDPASDRLPLDFSGLTEEARERADRGVLAWGRLQSALETPGDAEAVKRTLVDVLAPLGLSGPKMEVRYPVANRDEGPTGGRAWKRYIISGATTGGDVSVHQFGSKAHGRYQILVAWQRPGVEELLRWIAQCPATDPIIVLYMGTLGTDERMEIASAARGLSGPEPADWGSQLHIVVDFAMAAALATVAPSFKATLALALPFSWVDPYTPFVAGDVPRELFVGRVAELGLVLDSMGSNIIYGGRQFGKSALLRTAQRRFEGDQGGGKSKALNLDLKGRGIGRGRPSSDLIPLLAEELTQKGIPIELKHGTDEVQQLREGLRRWLDEDEDNRLLLLLDEADDFLEKDQPKFPTVHAIRGLRDDLQRRRFKPVFAGLHQVQRFLVHGNNPFAHLGEAVLVGALNPAAAAELVERPLAALGLRFDSPDLVIRLLTPTAYNPGLIQLFAKTLVERMREQPLGGRLPQVITDGVIDEVFDDAVLQGHVRDRITITLNLDDRYKLITYAMAQEFIDESGRNDLRLDEIKELCTTWWPAGFEQARISDIEILAREMVGLGILAQSENGQSFRLRSQYIVRVLGGEERIADVLLDQKDENPSGEDISVFRARIEGDPARRSPFPDQVVSESLRVDRPSAPVRVILGSRGTSIDVALDAIKTAVSVQYRNRSSRVRTSVGKALQRIGPEWEAEGGRATPRRPHVLDVVEIDLVGKGPEAVRRSLRELEEAVLARPVRSPGGSEAQLRVFVTVGPDALPVWDDLEQRSQESAAVAVIGLTRMDEAALRAWGREIERYPDQEEHVRAVKEVTGGWPLLVDDLYKRSEANIPWEDALGRCREYWDGPEGSASLLEAVGLERPGPFGEVFARIAEFGEAIGRDELVDYLVSLPGLDHLKPSSIATILRSLVVLEVLTEIRAGDAGTHAVTQLQPEPRFLRAWRTVHGRE